MCKQPPVFEWKLVENDAEWEHLCTPATLVTQSGRATQRFYVTVIVSIFLLVGATTIGWRRQAAAVQSSAELIATVQQELARVVQQDSRLILNGIENQHGPAALHESPLAEIAVLGAANRTAAHSGQLGVGTPRLEVQGEQAVAQIVLLRKVAAPAYRQTRFYRYTKNGWKPTTAHAELWGPLRSLETPSFVFHFRQNDAPAVIAVATRLEALNTTLRQNLGLPLPSASARLTIEVSITQDPGDAGANWAHTSARLVVASPARYLAPATLTDADLLLQSITLPLLARVFAQAHEQYQFDAAWQPLLDGLCLWQLWDGSLPLSIWRDDVVRWLYLAVPTAQPGQTVKLPERYDLLCAAHKLWLPSPLQINIPLVCAEAWEAWYGNGWYATTPLTRLERFTRTVYADENLDQASRMNWSYHPGQTVALATLIDYATVTYGRDRLPVLLATLGRAQSWATLLPVVYGISAAEFEAGWQAYLVDRYGVSLTK